MHWLPPHPHLQGGCSRLLRGRKRGKSSDKTLPIVAVCFLSSLPILLIYRRLHLTFANQETTLELPSMSSLLRTFMPRHNMPQLAYIANDSIASRTHDIDEVVDWDGVLNAVPKSKVSHSRKAMRHANKGLKDRVG